VAARIAALRRSSPQVCPQMPTLIAAEFPILAVEAMLAALTSFTLIGPLGLPWSLPIIGLAVIGTASAGCGISPHAKAASCGAAWQCCAACTAAAE